MKNFASLGPLLFSLFLICEGCKPKTMGDYFASYMKDEFNHNVSGAYVVIDLNGCGACNESLLTSLRVGSVDRDSVKLVLSGTPKQVSYYAEELKSYTIFADSSRKIYKAMSNAESFKLPIKIKY
jgi:hypothetical protein